MRRCRRGACGDAAGTHAAMPPARAGGDAAGTRTRRMPQHRDRRGAGISPTLGIMQTIPAFLEPLRNLTRPFPDAAVIEAAGRQEEATPHLLAALDWATDHADTLPGDAFLHLFAMYLLAEFRETRALRPLLRLARHPMVEDLLEDSVTEGLGRALAAVSGGETDPIRELIEDRQASVFARSAGLTALGVMALNGMLGRDELSAYLGELFDFRLEREPEFIWDQAVHLCAALNLSEHEERIRKAYADEFADPCSDTLEGVIERLHAKVGDDLDLHEFRPMGEAVDEMEHWYCFTQDAEREEQEEAWRENDPDLKGYLREGGESIPRAAALPPPVWRSPAAPPAPVRKVPTPGRNDPCPCGSGRKFKKCCGR